jgi:hypothetical protein
MMRLKGKKPEKIQSKEEIWKMDFFLKKNRNYLALSLN